MESFATPYACFFHDGDQEIDKGCIGVHSVLTFKRFQTLIAAKTGHPASSLSAVLVCTRTTGDTSKRQKLPINENTNFNIILNQHNPSRERDAHFLISLKKSKKERKVGAKKRQTEADAGEEEETTSSRGDVSPPEERPRPSLNNSEAVSPTPTPSCLRSPQPVPSPVSVLPSPNMRLSANTTRSTAGGVLDRKPERLSIGPAAKKEVIVCMTDSASAESPVKSSWQSPGILRLGNQSPEKIQEELQPRVHPVQPATSAADQEPSLAIEPQLGGAWGAERQRIDGRTGRADEEAASIQQVASEVEIPPTPVDAVEANVVGSVSVKLAAFGHSGAGEVTLKEEAAARGAVQGTIGGRVRQLFPEGAILSGGSVDVARLPASQTAVTPVANGVLRSVHGGVAMQPGPVLSERVPLKQMHIRNGMVQRQQTMVHVSQQLPDPNVQATQMMITSQDLHGVLKELALKGNGEGKSHGCRFCIYCKERDIVPTFHLCVYDEVVLIKGPSPAGPISRPGKRHVEAAA
eukprot:TRINITY_DN6140_c0_g1_i1.p1 TRINITY_DN6140_c0_g1~~TRINITY_DN6140_c0_g1_i1.p1  ORF type:complete len:520 (-),score=106.81 TRINITY_DN6140_c0_g1_i1:647-2206(-)